jgi:hypothetical protein
MAARRAGLAGATRLVAAEALRLLQGRAARWARDRAGGPGAMRRLAKDAQVYWRKATKEAVDATRLQVGLDLRSASAWGQRVAAGCAAAGDATAGRQAGRGGGLPAGNESRGMPRGAGSGSALGATDRWRITS